MKDEQNTPGADSKDKTIKAKRGIGMIRYLSKYLMRDVSNQLYKLYVRPHLDYGDIIYHKKWPRLPTRFFLIS